MSNFTHVTGHVIHSHQHYQGHGEGIAATLHQEIWIAEPNGYERHIHLIDEAKIPLRKGHVIEVIYNGKQIVGLINYNTKQYINFVPYAHLSADEIFPKFPSFIRGRDQGIVILALFSIGFFFEKQELTALFLFFAITGIVIYRLTQKPSVVYNDFYQKVELEINNTYGENHFKLCPDFPQRNDL